MSHVSSGLALAGFLGFVFAGFTLLAMGPLESLDAYFNVQPAPPALVPWLHVLDRIGQRAICLPILAAVTFYCCRRQESWRPAWVVALSVFSLNLLVLVLKLGLGRAEPASADPSFFEGGMAYPSGHTSNIVLVYGLCVFLLGRYGRLPRSAIGAMWGVVALLSLVMVTTSVTLRWHWFADLIAGLLTGGIVLTLTEALDAAVSDEAVARRVRPVLQRFRRRAPEPA
ncbi:MAG: phosphatase PAP2 family protein, partial [Nocardioidaceae bacterium]|nr:phosphatase PAP2 family protein [Nocardioidaceae bacterium]